MEHTACTVTLLSIAFVIILAASGKLVFAESNKAKSMCFTWTMKSNELRLICTINQLMYDVSILDEHGKTQASCLFPSRFEPTCDSYLQNSNISQDIATNTTILKVWHADGSLNGNWTCRHGRGKEQATVEITLTDYCDAFDKNTEWTFVGLIATSLFLNVAVFIQKLKKGTRGCRIRTNPSCLDQSSTKVLACEWFMCLAIICLCSWLPIYFDSLGKDMPIAIYAKLFIADGFVIGISCHIMSNIYVGTDNGCKIEDKDVRSQPQMDGSKETDLESTTQLTKSEHSSEKDYKCDKSDECEQEQSKEHEPNLIGSDETEPLFQISGHSTESHESIVKHNQSTSRDASCTII